MNILFLTLIDFNNYPNAIIFESVSIGKGTAVMAGAVINAGAIIGDGVIINTCASVDHDCRIGNFSHISVGARICGALGIGDCTWSDGSLMMTGSTFRITAGEYI